MAKRATNPSGRRSTTRSPRHVERRELIARRLLPAVERLLEHESYAEISVEALVAEAGISRSTFYNYFEDKGDLLRSLAGDVMGSIILAARGWWVLPPNADRPYLRDAIAYMFQVYAPHATLMRAVADWMWTDPRVREEFQAAMSRGAEGITNYIRAGQAAGTFPKEIDPARTAVFLDYMGERGLSELRRPDADYDPDRVVTAFTDIVWKATH